MGKKAQLYLETKLDKYACMTYGKKYLQIHIFLFIIIIYLNLYRFECHIINRSYI